MLRSWIVILVTCFITLRATEPQTMRLDYFHTGNASSEMFSVDQLVLEPLPWPGNPDRPIDDLNLGKYRFKLVDKNSGKLVFSRGFCSIYGEWELTAEAREMHRTFSESLRFPCPDAPAIIVMEKRGTDNEFVEIWRTEIDPKDKYLQTANPASQGPLIALEKNGDPSHKVDLLIIGDGYTAKERNKFEKDARKMMKALFSKEPYKSRRKDFNVWGLCPPSHESGISRPSTGQYRRSPLGCAYDAFGSERYILTYENKALRDIAAHAPYDCIQILVNGKTYGGGGIFGLYGTTSADNEFAPYIFVHEFGHHFAGLADEYYTSDVAYQSANGRPEPWEPNVTANLNKPKWNALLTPEIPIPTPWKKSEFEAMNVTYQARRKEIREQNLPETVMEALFRTNASKETPLLGKDKFSGKVGAFEGANYEAMGYYRSQTDCIMFTRNPVPFCAACQEATTNMIRFHTSKQ
ncbi:MAG: IgA Peptidase M64 [Holophagaceae bacterium]|nr:IgA Peptidase M64 [Holophagaceae bacterium]